MVDPFDEMRRMQREMNRLFERFFGRSSTFLRSFKGMREPDFRVDENKDDVIVEVELPGVDKKDIVLSLRENMLEIRAEKKQEEHIERKGYYKHKKSYGGYYRMISLPSNIDSEKAVSEYKNGVLKINAPRLKKAKKAKARKVVIK